MGKCSATKIFDSVFEAIIDRKMSREKILMALIQAIEEHDPDYWKESKYWQHPILQKCFYELHPL